MTVLGFFTKNPYGMGEADMVAQSTFGDCQMAKFGGVLFAGILYFVSATVNPILYNLMSKKYREAFKVTLCRCCLTAEQKRLQRESRGRGFFYSERSMTYMSVAGGNTTRLLSEKGNSHHGSPAFSHHGANRTVTVTRPQVCKTAREPALPLHADPNKRSSTTSRWGSWKDKLLRRKKDDKMERPISVKYTVNPRHRTANGSSSMYSDVSHSASSSPERTAADIREELELSDVKLPSHQRIICPHTGSAGHQGTPLWIMEYYDGYYFSISVDICECGEDV